MKRYINPEDVDLRLGALASDGELLIPLAAVRQALAVAPSVEIIHCDKCRMAERRADQYGNIEYYCRKVHDFVTVADFCSFGERGWL